ncbi:MAG TPA: TIGR04219 family outer membrane beta-barrel protein, partial [Sulfurimonas sp.]
TTLSYDMKQYDIIPYYNILDNTAWITLDLGLDIKIVDASYTAAPSAPFTGYSDSVTFALPLLYVRTRVEIPATNIGLEADVKYVTTGDSTVYDVRAKVDYTLDFIPVVQPALEVGYRVQKLDIDESGVDAKLDIDFSGIYAGLMLRF